MASGWPWEPARGCARGSESGQARAQVLGLDWGRARALTRAPGAGRGSARASRTWKRARVGTRRAPGRGACLGAQRVQRPDGVVV